MRSVSMFICAVALTAGCSDKSSKSIAQLDALAAKMCACKDKACTVAVEADRQSLELALAADFGKKPDMKLVDRLVTVDAKMRTCRESMQFGPEGTAGAAIAKVTSYKDQMCACKDHGCVVMVATRAIDLSSQGLSGDALVEFSNIAKAMQACADAYPRIVRGTPAAL